MLSDKELWEKALEVAKLFKTFEKGAAKGKTDRIVLTGKIMHSMDKVTFFDLLGKLIMGDGGLLASVEKTQLWESVRDAAAIDSICILLSWYVSIMLY